MFISVFLLKGIDLIIVSMMVILIGGAVVHYLRKDERLGQSIVSINLTFWVRFIVVESAKIFQNPETPISITSPLIFYTVASVATTIIAVFLTYRKYNSPLHLGLSGFIWGCLLMNNAQGPLTTIGVYKVMGDGQHGTNRRICPHHYP
jgi:hypothetical protein